MYVIFRLLRFPMMATGSIFSTFQPDSSSIVCLFSLSFFFFCSSIELRFRRNRNDAFVAMFQSLSGRTLKKKFRLEKGFKSYDFFCHIVVPSLRNITTQWDIIHKNNLILRHRCYPSSEKKISHRTNIFRLWYAFHQPFCSFGPAKSGEDKRLVRTTVSRGGCQLNIRFIVSSVDCSTYILQRWLIVRFIGEHRERIIKGAPLARARPPPTHL